ncbi:Molybdopterin molybdenumtransferase [Methanoculleus chikugoensis]|jgi:molybdopterin molybdotransferase|uniref:Molybdopterin molybdenumtransferase n=1 Tax=Methanoculleus chikugoensis TaxID=118126 RepID=A0A1M4MKP8_9EURY|nr:gephyrin-like molybdotransferase Glp [Methanoculleus chikugoensis]MDD4567040.1 molybdopterin molybdotransferase MoeA [Methanoculleus chikugoensis]SCL75484.1 Molybdopterin molybdenumtransferase [Methanoculleus chikugoensis]
MSLFLEVVSVAEAVEAVRRIAPPLGYEDVPLEDALHRVLAKDVHADIDIPGFDRSTVDGYAVAATETTGASEAIPAMLQCRGRVGMGSADAGSISPGSCRYVPTGGALPAGADAVVMIEHAEQIGDDILVHRPVAPGENVVFCGEDFRAGKAALERGRVLTPREIGVAAAIGADRVSVVQVPKIGIISTGNELVPVVETPGPGEVRDANSYLAGAFVTERGCHPVYFGIVRDERAVLKRAVSSALERCDAVLVSGGSSKDERDNTAAVVAELGEVLVHGIALAPGKPTIIGTARGKPVIGLPGHPASTFVVLVAVVDHLLAAMRQTAVSRRTVRARLTQNIPSTRGREDYVRVSLSNGEATPVFGKSGLLNTLVQSEGLVRIPASSEGFEVDEEVEVILW